MHKFPIKIYWSSEWIYRYKKNSDIVFYNFKAALGLLKTKVEGNGVNPNNIVLLLFWENIDYYKTNLKYAFYFDNIGLNIENLDHIFCFSTLVQWNYFTKSQIFSNTNEIEHNPTNSLHECIIIKNVLYLIQKKTEKCEELLQYFRHRSLNVILQILY